MRIRAGHYDILASGLVIAFRNAPIEFTLGDGQPPLRVRLVFAFDTGTIRLEAASSSDHDRTLTFSLGSRFCSPAGQSGKWPVAAVDVVKVVGALRSSWASRPAVPIRTLRQSVSATFCRRGGAAGEPRCPCGVFNQQAPLRVRARAWTGRRRKGGSPRLGSPARPP